MFRAEKQETPARSAKEQLTRDIMSALDQLGGQNVGEDALIFQGTQLILPEIMQGDISAAVRFLEDYDEQQNTYTKFSRTFPYRPYDGAAAFDRAMKRVFGTSGIGAGGFFSMPELKTVASGPGETVQVPWGMVELGLMDAAFALGASRSPAHGIVFQVQVRAPRRHRKRIEGFFRVIEEELRLRSIYKGQAITADPDEPEFLDTRAFDPEKVVYKKEVREQLLANLWSPVMHSAALRSAGIPLKRAVLLEGPNGTGKTLAGAHTAQVCVQNGWTFILVRAGDDPFEALNTAKMYAPAVVWVEDLEQLASASSKRVVELLDVLDNVQGKGTEVMAGFTSNFAELLVKDVVRPGRLDAVIRIAELDAEGYAQLIRILIPEKLLQPGTDLMQAAASYMGMLPAFAVEAIQRAVRYSIARNDGKPSKITVSDLASAAAGMLDHLTLMDQANTRDQELPALDTALAGIVRPAAEAASREALTSMLDGHEITGVDAYGDTMFTLHNHG